MIPTTTGHYVIIQWILWNGHQLMIICVRKQSQNIVNFSKSFGKYGTAIRILTKDHFNRWMKNVEMRFKERLICLPLTGSVYCYCYFPRKRQLLLLVKEGLGKKKDLKWHVRAWRFTRTHKCCPCSDSRTDREREQSCIKKVQNNFPPSFPPCQMSLTLTGPL